MFEATHPFLFFDYFRIPYEVRPAAPADRTDETGPFDRCGRLRGLGKATPNRSLWWPRLMSGEEYPGLRPPGEFHIDGIRGHGRLVPDAEAGRWLRASTTDWRRSRPVVDRSGVVIASLWQNAAGSVFLPFDPEDVITAYWSERYRDGDQARLATAVGGGALRCYYRVRPFMPRSVQIALRRAYSVAQARSRFPRWPVETALHDLYSLLFRCVTAVADVPVPWIGPWPDGHSWALVLTHDVDTAAGLRSVPLLRDIEVELGYRSSWNFVPERYALDERIVADLRDDGFEVGVHGLRHDGRDLESLAVLQRRLPAIRRCAERWNAGGFRSPATHRVWEWMPLLGFDYDSSSPDTDPFEPQPGGCCSWLPFFNGDLVELPITVPQDHTIFVILGHADERVWIDKIERIREAGGLALLITHPDYVAGTPVLRAYRSLLHRYRGDEDAWRALPRDVSAWWRRRAATTLVSGTAGWRSEGPAAAETSIMFADPSEQPPSPFEHRLSPSTRA